MSGALEVRGGVGGVAARTQEMDAHAALLDASGDAIRTVAGTAAANADPGLLLLTAPFAPASAAGAEWALVGAAARIGLLGATTELAADRLRIVAAAVRAADAWPRAVQQHVTRELSPLTSAAAVGAGIATGLAGALEGGVEATLSRTPWVDGPTVPLDEAALAGAMRSWGELVQTAPWLVDGLVHAGPEVVRDLLTLHPVTAPHAARVGREDLITALLGLTGDHGVLEDRPITVVGLQGPGAGGPIGSLTELVERQGELMERTRYEHDTSRLGVYEVHRPGGGSAWIVLVPGTQEWPLSTATDPSDLTTNAHLSATGDAALLDAIDEALQLAGVAPDEPLLLAGHSQGGIAATAFARQADDRGWHVTHVFTQGSPVQNLPPPPAVQMLSIEHVDDIVPRLDDGPNADLPNHTTVRAPSGVPPTSPIAPHAIGAYRDTVAAALGSAEPSVLDFADAVEQVFLGQPATQREFLLRREP